MLDIVDYLNDPVMGRIGLTAVEQDIVRTPTFRRLDRISNLGLGSLVFPGARHSRASHSLGALAVAAKLCNRLKFDDEESQKIRLAALLHDIGQYPLSHCIEHVYRQIGPPTTAAQEVYETLPAEAAAATTLPYLARGSQTPGAGYARDKDLAQHVILHRPDLKGILERHGYSQEYREELTSLIKGQGRKALHRFLLDSEYDCDRLDYVQRDAYFAGVRYGLIDLEYLIENMERRKYPPTSNDEVLTINRRKALHTFEHFLTGRYYMYSQIAYHRQIRGLELVAKAAFHALAEQSRVYPDFEQVLAIVPEDEFLAFDDGYFWSNVRAACNDGSLPEGVKKLCSMVVSHEPPRIVDELVVLAKVGRDVPGSLAKMRMSIRNQAILEDLCQKAKVESDDVAAEELFVTFLPTAPELPLEDVLNEKIPKDQIRMVPWLLDDSDNSVQFITDDKGSLLSELAWFQLRIWRTFLVGTEEQAENFRQALESALR